MVGGVGSGNNKIVATLRADCKVYPTTQGSSILEHQLANLINYKIVSNMNVRPPPGRV